MVSIKFLLILLPSVVAHLNVFISQPEVMKLLGLNAELYYVRDGVVNTYAMNFIVPVPAHISDLEFSWQSLTKQPLPYIMSVLYDSQGALLPPQVNISERGVVPVTVQTFRVRLPCSGVRSAEVEVRLQLNITAVNRMHEDTWLNFKRNKICLKDLSNQLSPNEESVPRAGPARAGAGAGAGAGGALYAAAACAVGMLAILVTAAAASALYFRTKKSRNNDSIHTSYTTAAYGSHGNVFIRLDALGRPASAGSGSYATIASIHKFPLGSRRSPSPYATTQLSGSGGGGGGGGGGGRGHIYARPEPPAYFPPTSSYCASDNLTCVSQGR